MQRAAARNARMPSKEPATEVANREKRNEVETARITEIPEELIPCRSRTPKVSEEPILCCTQTPEAQEVVQNARQSEHPFHNAKDATYAPPHL